MRTELISIATDTLPLDGAFYLPEAEPCGAVMLFHGNTMNFYVGAPRFLPPVLTRLGFACLAFNRRGHDHPGQSRCRRRRLPADEDTARPEIGDHGATPQPPANDDVPISRRRSSDHSLNYIQRGKT
jgi:pimeloyl-ACP methyl ester carboxylesterase